MKNFIGFLNRFFVTRKRLICILGVHKFIEKDREMNYDMFYTEYLGITVDEECVHCSKKVRRFYPHGHKTYSVSRTYRNTENEFNKRKKQLENNRAMVIS